MFDDLIPEQNAAPQKVESSISFDDLVPKNEKSGFAQHVGNVLSGLLRGAGSIGATIIAPYDMAKDAIAGKGLTLESNNQRRNDMDSGLQNLGAEPDSLMYKGGKLAGEIAGTAGTPAVLAKGAQAAGMAPKIVSSLASGGFTLGGAPAANLIESAANAGLRTAGGAAVGAASAGLVNPEDAKIGALIGGAMPGAVKVAGEAGKAAKSVINHLLGASTGTSAETVQAAYNAGKTGATQFADNMRGNSQFDDVVSAAKEGLARMRDARGQQYRSGMIDISNDKSILDFAPIENAMNRVMSIGNYKGVQTNKHASGIVNELSDTVANWKSLNPAEYHTPEGLDALKRAVGDIRDSTQFGTSARKAADTVYNAVKAEISSQAPTYSKVMSDYAKASGTLDEITRALSLGDKAAKDTAIRKLQSLMRNNAQTNYGNRLSIAKELEQQGGVSLTPAIAGQAMNTWLPRGMVGAIEKAGMAGLGGASLMNPSLLPAMLLSPLASPRAVGEIANAFGRASGSVGKAANAVSSMSPQLVKQLAEGSMRVSPAVSLAGQLNRQ